MLDLPCSAVLKPAKAGFVNTSGWKTNNFLFYLIAKKFLFSLMKENKKFVFTEIFYTYDYS
jgi:hypothetical protein